MRVIVCGFVLGFTVLQSVSFLSSIEFWSTVLINLDLDICHKVTEYFELLFLSAHHKEWMMNWQTKAVLNK